MIILRNKSFSDITPEEKEKDTRKENLKTAGLIGASGLAGYSMYKTSKGIVKKQARKDYRNVIRNKKAALEELGKQADAEVKGRSWWSKAWDKTLGGGQGEKNIRDQYFEPSLNVHRDALDAKNKISKTAARNIKIGAGAGLGLAAAGTGYALYKRARARREQKKK